jgi:hypothetical protein
MPDTYFALPEMRDIVVHHLAPMLREARGAYMSTCNLRMVCEDVPLSTEIVAINVKGRYVLAERDASHGSATFREHDTGHQFPLIAPKSFNRSAHVVWWRQADDRVIAYDMSGFEPVFVQNLTLHQRCDPDDIGGAIYSGVIARAEDYGYIVTNCIKPYNGITVYLVDRVHRTVIATIGGGDDTFVFACGEFLAVAFMSYKYCEVYVFSREGNLIINCGPFSDCAMIIPHPNGPRFSMVASVNRDGNKHSLLAREITIHYVPGKYFCPA